MFYGWKIVAVAFLTHFVSVGFLFYSYGVFFKSLAAEFGGGRLGISIGLVIVNLVTAALSPLVGRALDQRSIRGVMVTGASAMALGFFSVSQIDALWQFYLILGSMLAVGSMMLGGLPGSTLVANWFVQRRGAALGIAATGISFSGVTMAPIATALIASIGWRHTFLLYGAIALVVVVPVVRLMVVNRPEDLGLHPDGALADPDAARVAAPEPVLPLAQGDQMTDHAPRLEWSSLSALRDRNFWAITATVALNFCGSGAVLTHLVPFATDVGFSPLEASFALSATAAMGVTGKLLFGFVSDRIDRRLAFGLASALQASGVALLLFAHSYASLLVAGGVFGLGMGGIVPLWGAVVGAGFGRLSFGRVMGLMSPFMVPVQTLGIPLAGYIFDRTGHYDLAFYSFLGTYAGAIVAIGLLRLPHAEPGAVLAPRPASEPG